MLCGLKELVSACVKFKMTCLKYQCVPPLIERAILVEFHGFFVGCNRDLDHLSPLLKETV